MVFNYWVLIILYIFQIPVLCQTCGLKIFFSHSAACLFILLTESFTKQKFILRKSSLSILLLWVVLLASILRTHFLFLDPEDFFPIFFSRSVIVLDFTFKYMIHFKLIFTEGVRLCQGSFFCPWMSNCSSTTCWKAVFSLLDFFGTVV